MLGQLLGSERYVPLRYEDLLAEPAAVLRAIGQLCDLEVDELTERINSDVYFMAGHMVGGHRVRFQGEKRLKRDGSQQP